MCGLERWRYDETRSYRHFRPHRGEFVREEILEELELTSELPQCGALCYFAEDQ